MKLRAALFTMEIVFITICILIAPHAFAHGGGLNAEGCHNNRKTGGYHCHRSPSYSAPSSSLSQYRSNRQIKPRIRVIGETKVKTAQTLLQTLGYYNGPIDGLKGTATQKAILDFSRDKNVSSHVVDDNLIFKLSLAVSAKPIG